MDPILSLLAETVPKARTLEQLTRPLLALLNRITGLESTYLTSINLDQGLQKVEFARNAGQMQIPEGLVVPWEDTLCKRALDEGRTYTSDVPGCWGDSVAARALGIRTYASAPIHAHDGRLLGTVCAASAEQIAETPDVQGFLRLLSALLGFALERENLVERLQRSNAELASMALTDALTGLLNRRAILDQLTRMLAQARRDRMPVLVGMVDLDGFKSINDNHGHQAGDRFLLQVAKRMKDCLRVSDLIGRTGGDEFVVVAVGPVSESELGSPLMQQALDGLQARLSLATQGNYRLDDAQEELRYAGASVGVVAVSADELDAEEAVKMADREMYRVKQQRKSVRAG